MCVAAIAWRAHPDWLYVAVANRDEYHERPTAPLARWQNGIIAGQDKRAGGTWLGVSEQARFALVTNFRVPGYPRPELASRGALVTDWLERAEVAQGSTMNPFNLLLADADRARILSNYPGPEEHILAPGIHGLSNGAFALPWPKARRLCADLAGWLAHDARDLSPLFTALRNEAPFPEEDYEGDGPEPAFSGVFIRNAMYGTRSSTVVAVSRQGAGAIIERRFSPDGEETGETALTFDWPG
ncbi:MAG: NRDE family protein [Novosphingobium sp.]